jgi:hypothetical protein
MREPVNASLRTLQASNGATSLGKWGFAVALSVYAYRVGGASAVGVVALAQAIPAAIAAPLLSVFADRVPRQRVLLLTNAARAVLLGLVALSVWLELRSLVVFALAVVYAIVSTANQPARAALIPVLARTPREISTATTNCTTVDNAGFVLGAGLGGLLLATIGTATVLAACAVAYACSVALIARIPPDDRPPVRPTAGAKRLGEVGAGFSAIAADPQLRLLVGVIAGLSICDGLLGVLIVAVGIGLLDAGSDGVGLLNIGYGVGGLLAGAAARALLGRSRLSSGLIAGALALGLPLIALGLVPHLAVALLAWGAAGLGYSLVKISALTLLQRLTADRVLARVLGVLETTFVGMAGIGAILAPLLIALVGVGGALIVTGAFLPLLTLARWVPLRRFEAAAPVDAAAFARLRADPIFAPLPIATTEGLAGRLLPVTAVPGQDVVTQGTEGDRFYLLMAGTVEVLEDDVHRRHLGPGASFGEIALLHRVPRTATVRAVSPVELLALDRDTFLLAVTGQPDAAAVASDVASRYWSARAV